MQTWKSITYNQMMMEKKVLHKKKNVTYLSNKFSNTNNTHNYLFSQRSVVVIPDLIEFLMVKKLLKNSFRSNISVSTVTNKRKA